VRYTEVDLRRVYRAKEEVSKKPFSFLPSGLGTTAVRIAPPSD